MTRRHFLQSILALGVAPAIVRADSLMRIVPRETLIVSAVELDLPIVMDPAAAWQVSQEMMQWAMWNTAQWRNLQPLDIVTVGGRAVQVHEIARLSSGILQVRGVPVANLAPIFANPR